MSLFHLPDLGEGLAEASIIEWHVAPGDEVQVGQLLVSVETAKAVVDIPSPQRGRIMALLAPAGSTIPTHAPLVEFAEPDERPGPALSREDAGSVVGTLGQTTSVRQERFIIGRHRPPPANPRDQPAKPVAALTPPAMAQGEPLSPTRKSMADALARAQEEVVLVTLTDEVEIRFQDRRSLTARLVQALVAASRAEPALNAWYDGAQQRRQLHDAVHVGIAVDTPQGLFVPVLKDAQALSQGEIARRVAALRQDALAHRLTPAQLAGATVTLSNFGALSGRYATPLVTPPQVAILGAGHAFEGVRVQEGTIRTARLLPLSLSFDHRAVTGGEAARFLAAVAADLGAP
ncbi:MAG TPA: dihydrolipoamide acetyltransferase family protein [Moraxellaceae bacterium]|nr:dihydrolipoamide acetyltransferase family protein [Moraxellaceae bacterium]